MNPGGGNTGGVSLNPDGTAGDTCSFSVDVTGTTTGTKVNTISISFGGAYPLVSNDGVPGSATLTVTPPPAMPPTIAKAFNPTTVAIGQTSTLTFTITNPGSVPLTGVGFTDTFPANLFIQSPNGLTGSCDGGTITATPGTGTVSLSGATIAASGSCSFSVSVVSFVGTPAGQVYTNTTGKVTSNEAGAGNTAAAALTVTALSAQFAIGDGNAILGDTVTFWGAQWAKDNTLSGGPAPNAFKGFTDTVPANLRRELDHSPRKQLAAACHRASIHGSNRIEYHHRVGCNHCRRHPQDRCCSDQSWVCAVAWERWNRHRRGCGLSLKIRTTL